MQDDDIDKIAELVADRIRARVDGTAPAAAHQCDQSGCSGCGQCSRKRVEDVRAIVGTGAVRVAAAPGTGEVAGDLAGLIDHTLLKPDATPEDLKKLCEEARRFNFATCCVNSANVSRCRSLLAGSPVRICAVVGFPLGAMSTGAKAFEAREAVRNGASEIDMVINIGALKGGDYAAVSDDISRVVVASRPAKVKVILETGMLNDEEKVIGCTLAKLAGAHFVKTSTGFGKGGATPDDVALMRRVVGGALGVKASGGIRSRADAERMIAAGASRIGASASVAIVTGGTAKTSY